METEHWALLMSVVALFVSIGVPIWQSKILTKQNIANKRTLMLQTILATKSVNYSSLNELRLLLSKYHSMMGEDEKNELEQFLFRLEEHEKDLYELHKHYSNYDDGARLRDIEETQVSADLVLSEAKDTAKIVETKFRLYCKT